MAVEPDSVVRVEKLEGHRKFINLLPNYLYDFGSERESRMRYLAQLLGAVPVYQVQVPWDLRRLAETHEAVCSSLGRLR